MGGVCVCGGVWGCVWEGACGGGEACVLGASVGRVCVWGGRVCRGGVGGHVYMGGVCGEGVCLGVCGGTGVSAEARVCGSVAVGLRWNSVPGVGLPFGARPAAPWRAGFPESPLQSTWGPGLLLPVPRRHRQCPEGLRTVGSEKELPRILPEEVSMAIFVPPGERAEPLPSRLLCTTRPRPEGPVGYSALRAEWVPVLVALVGLTQFPLRSALARERGCVVGLSCLYLAELKLAVLCPHVSSSFFAAFSPPFPLSVSLLFF